jgi:predicted ATPase/DNA-binding XRE family transcriptional regulator
VSAVYRCPTDADELPRAVRPGGPAWDAGRIAALREEHGWTQEQLAERSGLSVRTIRNLELGWVRNPRRSSLDLLAHVLGLESEPPPRPAEHDDALPWRGPQPPGSELVGDGAEHERLAHVVRANRLTTFFGPGGVGKTRLALSVAARVHGLFRDGVVVVELGDLAPERHAPSGQAAAVLHRVRRQFARIGLHGAARESGGPDGFDGSGGLGSGHLLLVLDNAEHVPAGALAAARELLGTFGDLRILITARRRLTERLGANREIRPLTVEGATGEEGLAHVPAVQLVLRHLGTDSPAAAGLAHDDLPLVAELCRRLGGLPRYLEFAAERMRAVPIRLLLADGPAMGTLWSNDHALLRHQRSVADGIRWNLDLLTGDHHGLLRRIAALRTQWFTLEDVVAEHDAPGSATAVDPFAFVSDLLETWLLLSAPGDPYRYRLAPYVADVLEGEHRDLDLAPA